MSERGYGAIELGGTKVRCAFFVGEALFSETRIATTSFDETLAAIETFFAPSAELMHALGVASFGPLELSRESQAYGCLLSTPKPGWSDAPLVPRLLKRFGVPVRIDTDVNAAALAEQHKGAARGRDPVVYITVGTGIGVGVVIGGKPLHGLMHPEFGHLPAPPECDFVGACPFHGRCIEGVASGHALAVRSGLSPELLNDDHPLWDLEARYLGHLVAAVVLAYAPQRIVLGGGLMQRAGLLERVREQVLRSLASYVPRAELSTSGIRGYVVPPSLGDRAGLLGALLLARNEVHA
jgi:fructokinase